MTQDARTSILIVDDQAETAQVMKESLEMDGYDIQIINDPIKALKKLEEWQPDLLILDEEMPGIDGITLMKTLQGRNQSIPIMFVSACNDQQLICEALEWGADDYMFKPFSPAEFRARVHVRLRIQRNQAESVRLAHTDELTGLHNMRDMYKMTDQLIRNQRVRQGHIGCAMIDMDHLKPINDKYGHLFGAHVIKDMGRILNANIRGSDIAARYGGDEFLVILPGTDFKGTQIFSERIRSVIEKHTFEMDQIKVTFQTVSVGFCAIHGNSQVNAKELVGAADAALYDAKSAGRNRVIGYDMGAVMSLIRANKLSKRIA